MHARELRIGNLVQDATGKIIVAESVHESVGINFYSWSDTHHGVVSGGTDYEYSLDQIYPIPLTEEWLVRLGFEPIEFREYDGYGNHVEWRKTGFTYEAGFTDRFSQWYDLEKKELVITSTPYDENIIKCECVHHLQNAYYALTGEEIEIKK